MKGTLPAGVYRLFANGHGPQCPVCGTNLKPGQMHAAEARGVQGHVSFDVEGVKYVMVSEGGGYAATERNVEATPIERREQGRQGGKLSAALRASR